MLIYFVLYVQNSKDIYSTITEIKKQIGGNDITSHKFGKLLQI